MTTNTDETTTDLFRQHFEYHNVPISYLNSAIDPNCSDYFDSVDYYMFIVSQNDQIREILRVLASSKGGAAVYCTIGRDRTGVVCILLQMLSGCCLAEMVEGYALTDAIYEEEDLGVQKGFTREKARRYIITFLQRFYAEYHSAEEYLFRLGLTQDDIDTLRHRLIKQD